MTRARKRAGSTASRRTACLSSRSAPSTLQIATVTVRFVPTPGAALAEQIEGRSQGAEVIGSALLYPGQASDSQLQTIEDCVGQGVKESS